MIAIREIVVGARIELTSGEVREVRENPGDGMWLEAVPIDGSEIDEDEHMVYAGDIAKVL